MFQLNENLKKDCFLIEKLEISQLLLMNNANYPWLVLVPEIENVKELTDLPFEVQSKILLEVNLIAKFLQKKFSPDKLNIAMLGNMVPQLHIHLIARFKNDMSFPKPVWGSEVKEYSKEEAKNLIVEVKKFLQEKQNLIRELLYRSIHRGCKETDYLIGKFAKEKLQNFDEEKLQLFQQFIVEDDLLIYDWILGKQLTPDKYLLLIKEMQEFHNI